MAYLIYITFPNEEEARKLGLELVTKKLAAGVNILPGAYSIYHWAGKVVEAKECVLFAQVSSKAYEKLLDYVLQNHFYKVPCVVALPIENGNPQFLQWIDEHSQGDS